MEIDTIFWLVPNNDLIGEFNTISRLVENYKELDIKEEPDRKAFILQTIYESLSRGVNLLDEYKTGIDLNDELLQECIKKTGVVVEEVERPEKRVASGRCSDPYSCSPGGRTK